MGKIARCMFCMIKLNYIVNCNSFKINREKLGDYLKWTDYRNYDFISDRAHRTRQKSPRFLQRNVFVYICDIASFCEVQKISFV